jgi:hypothetical protein
MNDFQFSVLEYLGKLETGVLVILSIIYKKRYFEGTFFYTDEDMVFTISEELQEIIGDVKKHPNYFDMIKIILKIVVPYNEIYNQLDEVNFNKWIDKVVELENLKTPYIYDDEDNQDLA